jgi:hypothetical protein
LIVLALEQIKLSIYYEEGLLGQKSIWTDKDRLPIGHRVLLECRSASPPVPHTADTITIQDNNFAFKYASVVDLAEISIKSKDKRINYTDH